MKYTKSFFEFLNENEHHVVNSSSLDKFIKLATDNKTPLWVFSKPGIGLIHAILESAKKNDSVCLHIDLISISLQEYKEAEKTIKPVNLLLLDSIERASVDVQNYVLKKIDETPEYSICFASHKSPNGTLSTSLIHKMYVLEFSGNL